MEERELSRREWGNWKASGIEQVAVREGCPAVAHGDHAVDGACVQQDLVLFDSPIGALPHSALVQQLEADQGSTKSDHSYVGMAEVHADALAMHFVRIE